MTWGCSCSFCRWPRCISHVARSIQRATSSPRICCEERERPHQVACICTASPSTVVIWNGIDSREIYYCPVRRDAESSGCPARNTTLPNVPPVTSRSNPLPSRSNPLPSRSKPLPSRSNPLPSRSNPLPSSTTTHSSTSSHGGTFTLTTTISGLGGSSLTKTISDHDTTTVY